MCTELDVKLVMLGQILISWRLIRQLAVIMCIYMALQYVIMSRVPCCLLWHCSDGTKLHVTEERMKMALQYSPSQGYVSSQSLWQATLNFLRFACHIFAIFVFKESDDYFVLFSSFHVHHGIFDCVNYITTSTVTTVCQHRRFFIFITWSSAVIFGC